MGQRIITTCDYKPSKNRQCDKEGATEVKISAKGMRLSGDLCRSHLAELQEHCAKIGLKVEVSSNSGKSRGGHVAKSGAIFTNADARQWLTEQGIKVSPTGRLPQKQLDEYAAAH